MKKEKSIKGRVQAHSKLAGGPDDEENDEKYKLNVPGKVIEDAVQSEVNSRNKVESKLKR